MGKTLFPMCASFGPTFLDLGHLFPNRGGLPVGLLIALPGAVMVSLALNTLYREVTARDRTTTPQVEGTRPLPNSGSPPAR